MAFDEQEDGVGWYNDGKYNNWKDTEFAKRNWMRRKQSPQSLSFNANNYFYFQKLSKEILAIQSLVYKTRVLKNEKILTVVDKIWNDATDAVIMLTVWMLHY